MRPRRAGPRPRLARLPAALTVALLMLVAIVAVSWSVAAEDGDGWVEGVGSWGRDGLEAAPANATWLVVDGETVAYHVVADDGTRASCTRGAGTLVTKEGAGRTGLCGGEPADRHILLYFRPDGPSDAQGSDAADPEADAGDGGAETNATAWSGRFEGRTLPAVAAPALTDMLPLVAGLGALAALVIATVFGVLLVRERRLTGHLAARLWERTRGRSARRSEDLEPERVRRILVRSKN